MLAVEHLEARLFVREVEKVAAMLWQKPHLKPIVFKRKVLVCLVHLPVVQNILHRIGINTPLRTLIDTARVEYRRLIIPARRIRRERYRILFDGYALSMNAKRRGHYACKYRRRISVIP